MKRPIEIVESYLNTQVIDDKDLVGLILRVGLSAYTKNPLNLMVKAPSSEGKSYAVSQVISLFPQEDVLFLGGMSPAALIHERGTLVDQNNQPIEDRIEALEEEMEDCSDRDMKKDLKKRLKTMRDNAINLIDLNGKMLVFLDTPNWELWRRLKPILSHDRETIQFKVADKNGKGSLITKNTIIRGWPAVIYCSARNEEKFRDWTEIETRFLIASPNTEVAKYKKANMFTAANLSIPRFANALLHADPKAEDNARTCLGLLKSSILSLAKIGNIAYNPFYKTIAEFLPSNEGATMRIAKQFFALCNLETAISFDNNCKIVYENGKTSEKCPITSLREIERVITLLGKPSHLPPDKVKFFEQIFVPAVAGKIDGEIGSADLAIRYTEIYGKPTTPKKILENYLVPLYHSGILGSRQNPNDARGYLYKKISDINKREFDSITQNIIEQSKIDPTFVESGMSELEKHSSDKIYTVDSEGNIIPKDKLQALLIDNCKTNVVCSA